jgi:hypothetical protein
VTTASHTAERAPVRLLLSASTRAGRLDGSWWPRSRDLAAEFADLADNLPDRLGRIVNIAFSRSSWDPGPTWLPAGRGRVVRSRAFVGTADPDRVLLRLDSHRSLALMVVPPGLDASSAERAMAAAASPTNHLSARALIAQAAGRPVEAASQT